MVKQKVQIEIMAHYLTNNVARSEEQRIDVLNKQIKRLNEHELQVRKILDRFKKEDKKLHFAFLFACPLVLSYNTGESTKNIYKFIP